MSALLQWFLSVFILLRRRWRLLVRDVGQLILQIALIVAFPCLVVLFAMDGLPQIRQAELEMSRSIISELLGTLEQLDQVTRVGALVSGLVMFQVILLGLVGSNNTAREVVGHRSILEKEKLAGLAPGAVLCAQSLWMVALCTVQALWMTFFVKGICGIGGDALMQCCALLGTSLAISSICLAISAWAKTPESASLISIYLVGFQLPLSGALLALPEGLAEVTRPFIASYWGWSGYLRGLSDTPLLHLVSQASQPTPVASFELSMWMLSAHVVVGLFFAWLGLRRSQWS